MGERLGKAWFVDGEPHVDRYPDNWPFPPLHSTLAEALFGSSPRLSKA
jgi:hypothetical protein